MKVNSVRFIPVSAIFALTVLVFGCKKDVPFTEPNTVYNFDVILQGLSKNVYGSGLLKFRQNPDTARIADLDTWVVNLKPNTTYLLQRAVNPIADSTGCSSTAWLTLGLGSAFEAIHTDAVGAASTNFWRNLTSIARGTSFHIHFRVIDSASLEPALESECHDFTVQ
jgi:hypothetical protein